MTANRLYYGLPSAEHPSVIRPHECPKFLTRALLADLKERYGDEPKEVNDQEYMYLDMGGMKLLGVERIEVCLPYKVRVDLDQIPEVVAYLQYGLTKPATNLHGFQVVKLHRFLHTCAVFPAGDLQALIAELLPHATRATEVINERVKNLSKSEFIRIAPRTPHTQIDE